MELFFFYVHTTQFSDRNRYLSIGVHIYPQKHIFLTASFVFPLLVAFSNCSVFVVHTTELRFCLAPFSRWANVNAKPRMELKRCVFTQKRNSVNGAMIGLRFEGAQMV